MAVGTGTIFVGGGLFAYMKAQANISSEMSGELADAAEIEIQKEGQRLARRALAIATVVNVGVCAVNLHPLHTSHH